ncbi:hypothetical protein ACP70R_042276 [Stipagrostis hirtigluma subsp. patula]
MTSAATSLGLLFLTGNSVAAILRSHGDAATAGFVLASYLSLLLLFYSLRWFEAAPPESAARHRARLAVWLLTTLLTAMFSWRVAALVPLPLAAGVWLMAASTVLGGFYALFLLPRGDR